jgi:hypothetical protein
MRDVHRLILFVLLMGVSASTCLAQLAVVVSARSDVEKLGREEVINIFLGRFRQLPSGAMAHPIDLPASLPERAAFYRLLVDKELPEINAYWARLVFSGRTAPPRQARDNEDMLDLVATLPGAVGYIARGRVDNRVRVVLELRP